MIGYLDQFGTELPVKVSFLFQFLQILILFYDRLVLCWCLLMVEQSDAAGEVLKLLVEDGGMMPIMLLLLLNSSFLMS